MGDEKFWYRAENTTVTRSYSIDEYGDAEFYDVFNPVGSIRILAFKVERHTPKGVWIDDDFRTRWCGRNSLRGYAKPTIEEALNHLCARNKKRIKILEAALKRAKVLRDGFELAACEAQIEYNKIKGIYGDD